jgi:FtsP/CotA-like multicopper oxidase with cupredoxin domain
VFVIRQQFPGGVWLPGPYQLTVNYVPSDFPNFPPPVLNTKPGVKEFWRVANASTQAFLALQVWFGTKPQSMEVVALDGIPLAATVNQTTIEIPPAGRAEFIVTTPAAGATASFQNLAYNSGSIGNPNLAEELARVVASTDAEEPPALPPAGGTPAGPQRFAGLAEAAPTAHRKLYFAEATNGSNGPTEFLMGVEGMTPKVFNEADPPAIVTKVGAVEDWTIENRTGETHAFHIHQIHFLYMELNGTKLPAPALRDTVLVPFWKGSGPYPSVKLRMDFRDPQIAGTFVFHCHVLEHEDFGMMQKIQVDPK